MKKIFTFVLAGLVLLPSLGLAHNVKMGEREVFVEGVLVSFDRRTVVLKVDEKKVKLPRSSVAHLDTFLVGKSVVRARTTINELLSMNKK